MFFDSDNSKDAIKTRMLRIALTYWETKNTDELDPLVKLLMDALANEIYDVVNDIRSAEGRILEKMAHLMAPDLLTAATPAHAIMQASPGEPSEKLTPDDQYYVDKKIASKKDGPLDASVDVYFTPVSRVKIFDVQPAYTFSGANLYAYDSTGNKLLTANASRTQSNESALWLGLAVHTRITSLQGLSIFFDLKNIEPSAAEFVYQNLPFTKWYFNDRQIEVAAGLLEDDQSANDVELTNSDLLQSNKKNILSYYNKRFITLNDGTFSISNDQLSAYPPVFTQKFTDGVLQKLSSRLLWLKMVFPTSIQQELLNELNPRTNAFPVMNVRKNELRYRLRSGRNIIPLPNEQNESFLALSSLSDGTTTYRATPFKKSNDEELGTYTVRTGGIERFDSRNGKEMINYLLELLRSESAAFSAFGHDFIASTLKEMNQFIALMEQKTNAALSTANDLPSYVIVKPLENRDLMYLEYWTTNMELANNIRSGTKLQQAKGIAVKQDSLVLLTQTLGGKDKLKAEEKLYAFKYGLMTRDRIVTAEDIKSFCFYELGNRLGSVSIKKGYQISDNPREGLKKTIDISLTPSQGKITDQEEWALLCDVLLSKLQVRSGMHNNYRILAAPALQ